jgi:hypothetical protein
VTGSLPKRALAVAAVTVLAGHVAPSVDDNNRYLKITPLGDGVRLAYTVFFGEIPGASERRAIDANGDGRIDPAEAQRFGDRLAAQVLAALEVEADGKPVSFRWQTIDVGMGSDAALAGSFSIDMVAYFCLPGGAGAHRFELRDRFRIPRPGETEIKVDDSPGVTVRRARVGPHDDPTHDYRFVGPGGALSDDGLELEFTSTAATPTVPNAACGTRAPTRAGGVPTGLVLAIVGGLVALGAIALFLLKRRAS